MTDTECGYCSRPFRDPRGCEYESGDPAPLPYGSETDAYAGLRGLTARTMTAASTCSDCGAGRGRLHHATCLRSECPTCHHQFGLCGGEDCDAVWRWSTGEGRPAA